MQLQAIKNGAAAADQILVVDDEPALLTWMHGVLGGTYPLVFATNGMDALRLAREKQPALILLDVRLPDMDGYAVCCALRADPCTTDIPVILVSGREQAAGVQEALFSPAIEYLVKPVPPNLLLERVRQYLESLPSAQHLGAIRQLLRQLSQHVGPQDEDSTAHPWRMASYAVALAEKAGWSRRDCALLELAAPLHDIGKLAVPKSIMQRGLHDSASEWQLVKDHAVLGHDILSRHGSPVFDLAAQIALSHHEKWDGTGYPRGLKEREIPEAGQIVAIADIFDSLTMDRPGRRGWSVDVAMGTLFGATGSYFNPMLVHHFDSILPRILQIKSLWDRADPEGEPGGRGAKSH